MYNYISRLLLNSIKSHKKYFTQVIYNKTKVHSNVSCTNILWLWNNTTYKFYCQVAVQDLNTLTNSGSANIRDQQKLDEFISNPDNKKLFKIIELEVDVMRHNADKVPTNIKPKDWLELLKKQTRSQRRKYLNFLFRNEKISERKKQKKADCRAKFKEMKQNETEDTNEIKYGLAYNSLFLRIYPQTINQFYNAQLIRNMMFESKVVFDCSYENYMTSVENHNCAKQLTFAFAANRIHYKPMFLHFCNLHKNGLLNNYLLRNIPNFLDKDFPAVVTSQSYLDLFPKDQLVYLTPHCKTDMIEYDPDMIYIIGAMVDKANPKPLSLAKAKKEGLRMAKLPIEKYLDWGSGSTKNLTLNQIISIILDLRHTKSWVQALQHVPSRKLRPAREHMLQLKLQHASKHLEIMEKMENEKLRGIQDPMKLSAAIDCTFHAKKEK